ncbi:MAG TPA: TadE/TadG family type IV pilus assembly protein [Verrucomicrobiae bacterium]|nr:TadE/TadG family type IV pilus assembly protein [Verrucomicrobiae bacterium]
MPARLTSRRRMVRRIAREDRAAQLVEFAVALPLLVVFVVGIFDFSSAFTLKQKLTNVARDAARVAAAGPANDVPNSSTSVPASVSDAYQLISNYFTANKINNCGMTAASYTLTSPASWKYSANGSGCPGTGLVITINRGYYFPESSTVQTASTNCQAQALGGQAAEIGTCVSIQYAYAWRFGRVASLLGTMPGLPSTLSVVSVTMNEN